MGTFKEQFEQEMKQKAMDALSSDRKKEIKLNTLEGIISDIDSRKNRYIFYCPDIAVVNPLVKIVYEVALQVQNAGYNVVILHEMNGFKAKWLFESEDYKEYRKLPTEYVINKVSKKSKRTKHTYAFKTSDTLIVTDAFQDMLENILSEESLKLVQKAVLVTGYMGLSSLTPGMDYDRLNVNSLIFFDEAVKADYEELFQVRKNYIIDSYPVSKGFTRDKVQSNQVGPVVAITAIGNNDKAQQLINVFYNRYPNLSIFTFKVIARDSIDLFIDNLSTSAAFVVLDKNIATKQMVYEALNMGVPVVLPKRREFLDNKILVENFVVEDDVFEMADQIAQYCNFWLTTSTSNIKNQMTAIADKLDLNNRPDGVFGSQVQDIFAELQENRKQTFTRLQEAMVNG